MKKLLTLLISFLPVISYAQDSDAPSCGTNCTYTIENGVLTLKPIDNTKEANVQNYERYGYAQSGFSPWRFDDSITKIVVEKGITSIGRSFEDMRNVTEITLPEGLKTIGSEAFHGTKITKVDLPSTLTSIGSFAFSISSLKEINGLPEGLTYIGHEAFSNTQIKDFIIPESVKTIEPSAFGANTSDSGWNHSLIENLYCNNAIAEQCAAAVQWKKDLGKEVNVISYHKDGDKVFYKNQWYNSVNDILSGNNIKKRIYTVEEASKLSKPNGNTFKLRYK